MALTSTTATYGVRSTSQATSSGVVGNVLIGQAETQISLASADVAWTGQVLLVDSSAWVAGAAQVETATIVAASGCTTNGTMTLAVTSAGMTGSPLSIPVPLNTTDHWSAPLVAAAARTAIAANTTIAARFHVGVEDERIILTRRGIPFTTPGGDVEIHNGVNDATLNIAIPAGLGISAAATSANTTTAAATPVGAATTTINLRTGTSGGSTTWSAGSGQVETATIVAGTGCTTNGTMTLGVTSAGMTVSPLNIPVALTTALNTAPLVAAAARAALAANATIAARFTVGGTAADIVLTRLGAVFAMAGGDVQVHNGVDDSSFNIAIPGGLGITADTSSDGTAGTATSGVLHRDVDGKDWEGTPLTAIAAGKIAALQITSALNSTAGIALDHAAADVGFDLMPLPPGGVVLVAAPSLNSTISDGLILSSVTGGTAAMVTISVVGRSI